MVVPGFRIESVLALVVGACLTLSNPAVRAGGEADFRLVAGHGPRTACPGLLPFGTVSGAEAEADALLGRIGRDATAAAKLLHTLERRELPAAGAVVAALLGLEHALGRHAESLVRMEATLFDLGDWCTEEALAAWHRKQLERRDRLVHESAAVVAGVLEAADEFAARPGRRDTMALLRIECAYHCLDNLALELRTAAVEAERFCESAAALPAATSVQAAAALPEIERWMAIVRGNVRALDAANDSMTHLARGSRPDGNTATGKRAGPSSLPRWERINAARFALPGRRHGETGSVKTATISRRQNAEDYFIPWGDGGEPVREVPFPEPSVNK